MCWARAELTNAYIANTSAASATHNSKRAATVGNAEMKLSGAGDNVSAVTRLARAGVVAVFDAAIGRAGALGHADSDGPGVPTSGAGDWPGPAGWPGPATGDAGTPTVGTDGVGVAVGTVTGVVGSVGSVGTGGNVGTVIPGISTLIEVDPGAVTPT